MLPAVRRQVVRRARGPAAWLCTTTAPPARLPPGRPQCATGAISTQPFGVDPVFVPSSALYPGRDAALDPAAFYSASEFNARSVRDAASCAPAAIVAAVPLTAATGRSIGPLQVPFGFFVDPASVGPTYSVFWYHLDGIP